MRLTYWTTLVNLTLALCLVGAFAYTAYVFEVVIQDKKSGQEMRLFLREGTTEQEAETLLKTMLRAPYVANARYLSKADALAESSLDEADIVILEGANPLPASVNLRLKPSYTYRDSVVALGERILRAQPTVVEVNHNLLLIDQVNAKRRVVHQVGAVVGVMLLFIAYWLMRNTVRLAIHGRRQQIRTMQLVGATGSFIAWPFVRMGLGQGLLAGLLAALLLLGATQLVERLLLQLDQPVVGLTATLGLSCGLIVVGGLLGYLASRRAVWAYLRATKVVFEA